MAYLLVLDEQVEIWGACGGPDTDHLGVSAEHPVDKVTCKPLRGYPETSLGKKVDLFDS
jgi:hypothetical protein